VAPARHAEVRTSSQVGHGDCRMRSSIGIKEFFVRAAESKTGAIVAADFYYNERARRDLSAR